MLVDAKFPIESLIVRHRRVSLMSRTFVQKMHKASTSGGWAKQDEKSPSEIVVADLHAGTETLIGIHNRVGGQQTLDWAMV